ncbi:DUF805 domain-containing protein [Cognatishimia maritima]|uniref:Uncharacterized membrane protein YhaH, DUF805 family n=1 Tax=Cognatishimia maritima TaxID=870908 RepID=A0A1M5RV01_9RHOB|nr:DUF805 domain-containing protein [Cognatishimia maritima]SHH30066.1 Uncharacterized membrane protein YhaH, DUF805 family [Cognatishimia maritima]
MFENAKVVFFRSLEFKGRSDRYELWSFAWLLFLTLILLTVVNSIVFGPTVTESFTVTISNGVQSQGIQKKVSYDSGWLGIVLYAVVALPLFSVCWRRLHDTGLPGWLIATPVVGMATTYLIFHFSSETVQIDTAHLPNGLDFPTEMQVPQNPATFFIGWAIAVVSMLVTVVLLTRSSQPGPNKYGPNPYEVPT